MLIKYPKIDALFERNSDLKLSNTFRDPAFEYLKDLKWQGFEKLDGTNVRIYWDGYRVSTHGRTDNAVFEKSFEEYLEKFKSKEFEELMEQIFGEKEVHLFGEGLGQKIQGGSSTENKIVLFDVLVQDNWLKYEDVKDIGNKLGLEVVNLEIEGTLNELIEYVKTPRKASNKDIQMEGLIARPKYNLFTGKKRIQTKIKFDMFKGK